MKRVISLTAVMTIMIFIFSTEVSAQRGMTWKGSGGWGAGTPYGRLYNLQTVETITGEVVTVDKITPMKGTISVHLGPGWYIENQDLKIAPNDKIEIKGSRITFEDKPTLIAAEVKKGDDVLVLRDASGFPVWSGWRRR
jgi:hypothetical protein